MNLERIPALIIIIFLCFFPHAKVNATKLTEKKKTIYIVEKIDFVKAIHKVYKTKETFSSLSLEIVE